jgi:hypothetical protein
MICRPRADEPALNKRVRDSVFTKLEASGRAGNVNQFKFFLSIFK